MKGVMKLSRDPLLRRSVCAAGQPARPQVNRCTGLSGSDREYPALTGRSGTQRARACFGEHLIRRSGHIVQHRTSRSVCWADIPHVSMPGRRCPPSWQQVWQQSRRGCPNGFQERQCFVAYRQGYLRYRR
jgi:hypothetical protein